MIGVVAYDAGLAEFATTKTTQFDLLRDVSSICRDANITLRLRLHPSEK
jgi:hypothetical protein